jgi:hypothetical protein
LEKKNNNNSSTKKWKEKEVGNKNSKDIYPGKGAPAGHRSRGRPRSANEGLGYDGSLYVGVVP